VRTSNERVDRQHDKEIDGRGDQEKGQECIDEISIHELASSEGKRERGKVWHLPYRAYERRDQVLHDRCHHCTKRCTDDDTDGKINDVSPEYELFESFEHGCVFIR